MIDSRAARVLAEGRRDMIDEGEWRWIVEHARGQFDHLIVASTLPVFMSRGLHQLEALSEAVCDGAWGARAARVGERVRRGLDLEHWPAFQNSFGLLVGLLDELARGDDAPGTILLLGGDVHTAYVAEVELAGAARQRVCQIVCSPFRNPLGRRWSGVRSGRRLPRRGRHLLVLARRAGIEEVPSGGGSSAGRRSRTRSGRSSSTNASRAHDQHRAWAAMLEPLHEVTLRHLPAGAAELPEALTQRCRPRSGR